MKIYDLRQPPKGKLNKIFKISMIYCNREVSILANNAMNSNVIINLVYKCYTVSIQTSTNKYILNIRLVNKFVNSLNSFL